jgi:putative DNA methylase
MSLKPFSWRDRPALIEHLFPVQKLSAESFKEQMANLGKTLTGLGSYWKGRKPLVLNKACILGCLLPSSGNAIRDLEIFEMLMGMDKLGMRKRLEAALPKSRADEALEILRQPYGEQVDEAKRAEELGDALYDRIWEQVNAHLGTSANCMTELVEEMGVARFGHRPKVADVFCGSGQIPFEAARIGCDVYASDLNPVACMLTWGAFNIVGAAPQKRLSLKKNQLKLANAVQIEIDKLGIEEDGAGWKAKSFLYCLEVICPESGWRVPLLPTLIISKGANVHARLVPDQQNKRYEIQILSGRSDTEMSAAADGTISGGWVTHSPDGKSTYRVKIDTIRGDYTENGQNKNRLRLWEKEDFTPRPDDIFQERLYCIQWMKQEPKGKEFDLEYRSVTEADLDREQDVIARVHKHLAKWQDKGIIPDMVIESGYNTDQPIRERGWTHWHHLFNPRQLLYFAILHENGPKSPEWSGVSVFFAKSLEWGSRLSRWNPGWSKPEQVFYNQALNTFYNYGCRSYAFLSEIITNDVKSIGLNSSCSVKNHQAEEISEENDLFITDPPYGDAVKYEEITEFFIAWLRKNPPPEFANWTWDSRRALAIKGEDDDFRRGMIRAYRRMAELMPDNGMQVLMFTHKSGNIWADLANIIWASGLKVTAAWYVVTESDSALRDGANVTGTVLLILRRHLGNEASFRDDLAWEIEAAVKEQIEGLVGLDNRVRQQGSEGLYRDADLQMAGYAAALKVLTGYSQIDGKNMVTEAEAPRVKGRKSFVDELIDFAVQTAVQFLVPVGFEKDEWQKLEPVERFYLKMVDIEHQGQKTLDNYINFSKAFRVKHHDQLLADNAKANSARLKLSTEFKSALMSGDAEIAGTPLRALLYALFELSKETDIEDVLLHLMENCPNYNQNKGILVKMADYIAAKRETLAETKAFQPHAEASRARILAEALRNQRL